MYDSSLTTIVCASDLHGKLFDVPPCDILILAGDTEPSYRSTIDENVVRQFDWLANVFDPWLRRQPAKHTVAVFGNHSWCGAADWYPKDIPWTLLTDQATTICGLKFYGLPWSSPFYDWAFMLDEPQLAEKYAAIPDDTDIIVSHGPPYCFGDLAGGRHVGSPSLDRRIQRINPALVVYGHIHAGSGFYHTGNPLEGASLMVNASLLNDEYKLVYPPRRVVMEGKKVRSWY